LVRMILEDDQCLFWTTMCWILSVQHAIFAYREQAQYSEVPDFEVRDNEGACCLALRRKVAVESHMLDDNSGHCQSTRSYRLATQATETWSDAGNHTAVQLGTYVPRKQDAGAFLARPKYRLHIHGE
jgi:hypothetical protein